MTILHSIWFALRPTRRLAATAILVGLLVGAALWWLLPYRGPVITNVDRVLNVFFSPDGRSIVSAEMKEDEFRGTEWKIRSWHRNTGEPACDLEASIEVDFRAVAFSPDGNNIAGLGTDHNVYVWARHDGRKLAHFSEFHAGGRLLYDAQGRLIWFEFPPLKARDVARGKSISSTVQPGESAQVHLTDDFLLAMGDTEARVWHLSTEKLEAVFPIGNKRWWFNGTAILQSNGKCLAFSEGRNLHVALPGRAPILVRTKTDWNSLVAVSHDGSSLGVYQLQMQGDDQTHGWIAQFIDWVTGRRSTWASYRFILLEVPTGRELATFDHCYWGKWSPDGKTLAVVSAEGKLHLFDWPLRKPWAKIVLGAVAAAVATVLLGKLCFLLRRKRSTKTPANQPVVLPPS